MDQSEKLEKAREAGKLSMWFLATELLGYTDWDVVHDELEKFIARPARKKAILMPRGHLKTSLVTITKTIQFVLRDPNVRILIANQVWDRARDILREIKGHLETGKLPLLYGQFVSHKWTEDAVVVRGRTKALKEPTIATTGVEAETTGGHYDVIILDDLIGLQNSQTPELREKAKRFRRSMKNLLEPTGKLIEIGTRWHLDDTFADILDNETKYYDVLIKKIVENGKVIFPKKFNLKFDEDKKTWMQVPEQTMDYVEFLKASMPLEEFYAQYMNEPIATENQTFTAGMFKYWDKRPEGLYVVMAADLAISQKVGADSTAIVVLGMDREWNVYVLDYIRGKWTPTEIVANYFSKQQQWRPHRCGMEVNGFQRTLKIAVEEEMRRQRQYFHVEEIRQGPAITKENRIKSLEPFYRRMAVHHASWMKGKELEVELLTFPKGRHDDLIDAMAMCLPMLSHGIEVEQRQNTEGTWHNAAESARRLQQPYKGYLSGL